MRILIKWQRLASGFPDHKWRLCLCYVYVVLAECLRCVCIDQGCAYVVFALSLCWSRSCSHHACVVLALIEVVQSSDRWCNASGCCIVMWEKKWIWQKRWTNPLRWRLAICQQWWWFHYKGAVRRIWIDYEFLKGGEPKVLENVVLWLVQKYRLKKKTARMKLCIDHLRLTSHEQWVWFCCFQYLSNLFDDGDVARQNDWTEVEWVIDGLLTECMLPIAPSVSAYV